MTKIEKKILTCFFTKKHNYILDSFAVGSSTRRVTKGIWVDSCLDYTNKIATIYLDVEGFGDPEKV
jgi:hypothetical protein